MNSWPAHRLTFLRRSGRGMRLVLVGPPGSGKGTQAKLLVERAGAKYIGTGDILRDEIRRHTDVGKKVERIMRSGRLVPDDLVNRLIEDLFRGSNAPSCFVLDGYPRTRVQAVWFDRLMTSLGLKLDGVAQLVIEDEEVVRRIIGRRICPVCGRVYHITDRPPRVSGVCDHDGAMLEHRPDDQEETIRERLRVFHENTDSLLEHYRKQGLLNEVSALGGVEQIYSQIARISVPSSNGSPSC